MSLPSFPPTPIQCNARVNSRKVSRTILTARRSFHRVGARTIRSSSVSVSYLKIYQRSYATLKPFGLAEELLRTL